MGKRKGKKEKDKRGKKKGRKKKRKKGEGKKRKNGNKRDCQINERRRKEWKKGCTN